MLPRVTSGQLDYHLAWDVTLPVEKAPRVEIVPIQPGWVEGKGSSEQVPVQWRYLVDAASGDVLERINQMVYEDLSGTVTGMVLPELPTDTPAQEPIGQMTLEVTQGATTHSADTGASGDYTVSGLVSGAATLEAHLTGPYVEAHNNETPDPDATHSAAVTVPGTHSWDWSADDPAPSDAETNGFYHVGWIREWFLKGAPFDVSPTPDPMQVYVRDGPYCNAGASSSGLYFGVL